MFESLITDLLNRFLGDYIYDFDPGQVKAGVWKGEISFVGLRLKPDIVDQFALPITIKHGYVGKLKVLVPWKQLFPTPSKPVSVEIDEVFLVVSSKDFKKEDHERIAELETKSRKKAIEELNNADKVAEAEKKKEKSKSSFATKLVTSIINNIQVNIGRVHVRVEDDLAHPGVSFSFGVTLHDLRIESVDDQGRPFFYEGLVDVVRKKLTLGSLSIYFDRLQPNEHIGNMDIASAIKLMNELLPRQGVLVPHAYILHPVSLRLEVVLNTANVAAHPELMDVPKISINGGISRFALGLTEDQLVDAVHGIDRATRWTAQRQFLGIRVLINDGVLVTARQRWIYAGACIKESVSKRRKQWMWATFAKRRTVRKDYLAAYSQLIKDNYKASSSLSTHLEVLESQMQIADIKFYRAQAEAQTPHPPPEAKGFLGGLMSKVFSSGEKTARPLAMSDDERKAMYGAIGYSPDEDDSKPAGEPTVAVQLRLDIESIEVALRETSASTMTSMGGRELLGLHLDGLSTAVKKYSKPGSMDVDVTLTSLRILESISSDNAILLEPEIGADGFLTARIQLQPADGKVDSRISLKTNPLTLTHRHWIIPRIVRFFAIPPNLMLSSVSNATQAQLSAISSMSKAGLIHAIENHKTIDLAVHIGAPTLHFVLQDSTTSIIASLGSIRAKSLPLPPEARNLLKSSVKAIDAAYDDFEVFLEGVQCTLLEGNKTRRFLDPINVHAKARQCVYTGLKGFPNTIVSIGVDRVHLNISLPVLLHLDQAVKELTRRDEIEAAQAPKRALAAKAPAKKKKKIAPVKPAVNPTEAPAPDDEEFYSADEEESEATGADTIVKSDTDDAFDYVIIRANARIDHVGVSLVDEKKGHILDVAVNGITLKNLEKGTEFLKVNAAIEQLLVNPTQSEDPAGYLLESVQLDGGNIAVLDVVMVESTIPSFQSRFNAINLRTDFRCGNMRLRLHLEVLQELIAFAAGFTTAMRKNAEAAPRKALAPPVSGAASGPASGPAAGTRADVSMARRELPQAPGDPTRERPPVRVAGSPKTQLRGQKLSPRLGRAAAAGTTAAAVAAVAKPTAESTESSTDPDPDSVTDEKPPQSIQAIVYFGGLDIAVGVKSTPFAQVYVQNLNANFALTQTKDIDVAIRLNTLKAVELPSNIMFFGALGESVLTLDASMPGVGRGDPRLKVRLSTLELVALVPLFKSFANFGQHLAASAAALSGEPRRRSKSESTLRPVERPPLEPRGFVSESSLPAVQERVEKKEAVKQAISAFWHLDVDINTPIIVVPETDTLESRTFELQLGRLQVKNAKAVHAQSQSNLDDINLVIDGLQLKSMHAGACLHNIIDPSRITLSVKRRLDDVAEAPNVEVTFGLDSLKVYLRDADVGQAVSILNSNVNGEPFIPPLELAKPVDEVAATPTVEQPASLPEKVDLALIESAPLEGGVPFVLVANACLKLFSFQLQLGTTPVVDFRMVDLSLSVQPDGEGSSIALSLGGLSIDDVRPNSNSCFKKILTHDNKRQSEALNLITVKARVQAQRQSVQVTVAPIAITANTDFIKPVLAVFADLQKRAAAKPPKSKMAALAAAPAPAASAAPAAQPIHPGPKIMAMVTLQGLKATLIEDASDHLSRGVRAGFSGALLEFARNESQQNIVLTAEGLRVGARRPLGQHHHWSDILQPSTVILTVCRGEDFSNSQHYEKIRVDLDRLALRIGYKDLTTAKAVVASLKTAFESSAAEVAPAQKSTCEYGISPISPSWYNSPRNPDEIIALANELQVQQTANVTLQQIDIAVVDDSAERDVRLLGATITVDLEATGIGIFSKPSKENEIQCNVYLAAASFNDSVSSWEPIIDQLPIGGQRRASMWSLSARVLKRNAFLEIEVESSQQVPLTVTLTANAIGKILNSAFLKPPPEASDTPQSPSKALSPIVLSPDSSEDAMPVAVHHTVQASDTSSIVIQNDTGFFVIILSSSSRAGTPLNHGTTASIPIGSGKPFYAIEDYQGTEAIGSDNIVYASFLNSDTKHRIVTSAIGMFAFPASVEDVKFWLIAEIVLTPTGRKIVLRSTVKFTNASSTPLDILYRVDQSKEPYLLSTMEPGVEYSLPARFVRGVGQVFVRPADQPNGLSTGPLLFGKGAGQLLTCPPQVPDSPNFNIIATYKEENYANIPEDKLVTTLHHHITFRTPVVLRNDLPFSIIVRRDRSDAEVCLAPADQMGLFQTDVQLRACVPVFNSQQWIPVNPLKGNRTADFSIPPERGSLPCMLRLDCTEGPGGYIAMRLYAPFWLVNKTGLDISFKQNVSGKPLQDHPHDYSLPLLFAFAPGSNSTQALVIKSTGTDWSRPINVNVVGHSEVIELKRQAACVWKVSVSSSLASNGMTKIITLEPFTIFTNRSELPIVVEEAVAGGVSVTLAPGQVAPCWPKIVNRFRAGHQGSPRADYAFSCERPGILSLVARPPNSPRAVSGIIDVTLSMEKANMYVSFSDNPACSEVRIENSWSQDIEYRQCSKEAEQPVHRLAPGMKEMFFRDDPEGPLAVEFRIGAEWVPVVFEQLQLLRLRKDPLLYAIVFADSGERVLVVTDDLQLSQNITTVSGLSKSASLRSEGTLSVTAVSAKLHSANFSIIDATPKEIISVSIGPREVWQYEVEERNMWGDRWERFANEDSAKLQKAAIKGGKIKLKRGVTVDLDRMRITVERADGAKDLEIRRVPAPGLLVSMFDNSEQVLVRLGIESLQIDNHVPQSVCPVILRPKPQSASDLPIVRLLVLASSPRLQGERAATIVHRLALQLQPISVATDDIFLTDVIKFAGSFSSLGKSSTIKDDLDRLSPLLGSSLLQSSSLKTYFTMFDISMIEADISFFLVGGEDNGDDIRPVKNMLKAVGVALSNIEGVPFKLAELSIRNVFCSQSELTSRLVAHYMETVIYELYKVLGCLDIIGNPVKLFGHLNTGISDLFTKPDLIEGFQSLASNAVAGTFGVVTGIASSVGNSLAVLSMDDDYQRKRREENLAHKSSGDEVLHGGKRMMTGIADGLAGIIAQPLQGAQKGGALGFLKGVGKGLVGAVVKPVAGVVDMTTSTVNAAVKLTASHDAAPHHVRNSRLIRPDKVVSPFSSLENDAYELLQQSKLLGPNELYWTHYYLREQRRIVYYTSRSLLYVQNGEKMTLLWRLAWDSIERAEITAAGVGIVLAGPRPRVEVIPADRRAAEHIQRAVSQLLVSEK
eukprot:m.9855 g.9855  ORF g.9855 m.9855 type:complete len:3208 (+) comp2465_c0_seq1:50-9673(+)